MPASKTGAGVGNDWLGRASGIVAVIWHYRGDDSVPMEEKLATLLIWKGCGSYESVAAVGTEQATASATTVGGRRRSYPLARRGEVAAKYGLNGSVCMATCFGNNGRAGDPFPRRKRTGNARA